MNAVPAQGERSEEASARALRPTIVFLALTIFALTVQRAWMSDDAFISLRCVDNLVHGYGLTWNTDQRVQAFTNPLWTLLLSVPYSITREAYFTTLLVSLVVSGLFLVAFVRQRGSDAHGLVLALLALVTSKTFVDYSTSGLENPLTHLLLCLGYLLFWNGERDSRDLLRLSLVGACLGLNRLDSLLLFLPALAVASHDVLRARGLGPTARAVLLGFAPLLAWELFALFYYGFPFPNSAYAKLNTEIPTSDYFLQGIVYFFASFRWDPATFLVLAFAAVLASTRGRRGDIPALAGLVLYLLYVSRIGGDFMAGRFFAAPFVLACLVIARFPFGSLRGVAVPATVLVALGLAVPHSPLSVIPGKRTLEERRQGGGVEDERLLYFARTGLLLAVCERVGPSSTNRQARGLVEEIEPFPESAKPVRAKAVGSLGYYAGPHARIIDPLAITDPLLARLPGEGYWYPGHFTRTEPAGYFESREAGGNLLADPDLAAYYDRLLLVTSGELWSWERLRAIVGLNAGSYDHLLRSYAERQADRADQPAQSEREE